MIKNKPCSTAFKMALAGMCTALVLENTVQNGLFVPAHAEDTQESDAEILLDQIDNTLRVKAQSTAGLALFKSSPQAACAVWGAQTMTKIALEHAIQSGNSQDFVYEMGNYSFASGTYIVSGLDDNTHYAMAPLLSGSFSMSNGSYITLCESDTFNLRYTMYDYNDNYTDTNFVVTYNGNVPGSFSVTSSNSWGRVTLHNAGTRLNGNYFAAEMSGGFYGTDTCQILVNRTSVPIFDYNTCKDSFLSYIYSKAACNGSLSEPLFGVGVTVTMPEGEFEAANISGYYNDVLLPWMSENYPDTVDLVAFPNGIDGSDLPDVGTLDSLTFPPGLPSSSFNDVELPSEPLPAKMLSGASFWFTQFTNLLDALGVKYIVITFLIIALIMAILKI